MAITNHERVGKGLELLKSGLGPFVEREFKNAYRDRAAAEAGRFMGEDLLSESRDHRNKWAHQETFSSDDAYRTLDSAGRLLTAVSAPKADEIEKGGHVSRDAAGHVRAAMRRSGGPDPVDAEP